MIRLLAFLLVCLPGILSAQTVRVLGGEHADFTRLTLNMPRDVAWEYEDTAEGFAIKFRQPLDRFDLSRAFERIPKARVQAITPSDDRDILTIRLGCNCRIERFQAGPNLLAIDVFGTPDGRRLVEKVTTTDPSPTPEKNSQDAERIARLAATSRDFHLGISGLEPQLPTRATKNPGPKPAERFLPSSEEHISNAIRVKEAEERLLERIGRATSQGLLTKSRAAPRPSVLEIRPASDARPPDQEAEQAPAPKTSAENHIQLRTENSLLTDNFAQGDVASESLSGMRCLAGDSLNIVEWGSDLPFAAQVAEKRGDLFGEFDRVNSDTALALAKTYLYFGFGAEAAQTMELLENHDLRETTLLLSLARIMDQGWDANPGPLIGQETCDNEAALWSILASPQIPVGLAFNENALLRSFTALPDHLKTHLGPTLIKRLLAAHAEATADKVTRLMSRGLTEMPEEMPMIEAERNLSEGDLKDATENLKTVVAQNNELSPQALVKMVDADIQRGTDITIETHDLVESYAFQFRDTDVGRELTRVSILAKASLGDFAKAFSAIRAAENEPYAAKTTLQITEMLSRIPDDFTFMRHALNLTSAERASLKPDLQNNLAERVLELGFPSQAADFVKAGASEDADRNRRIIRAKIALAENLPRRAEADLLGLSGADVDAIRAEARNLVGDYMNAQTEFSEAGLDGRRQQAAWLAGDWDTLSESSDPVLASTARMIIDAGNPDNPEGTQGELARNRDLISQSASARETLGALLSEMDVNEAPLSD